MKTLTSRRNSPPSTSHAVSAVLGKQLLDAGKLTEHDIQRIVAVQHRDNLRFGEAAIELELLTELEIQEALARQYEYPYLPLGKTQFSPLLVAASKPFGKQSEALRALRSQLLLRWFSDRRKVIAVTATRAGEGASTVAANLALMFAQLGERTLLIDANFRRPILQLLFGLKASAGLSSLLTDRSASNDVLTPVPPFENLTVLCAGAIPPNPQELLSRVGFSYLVETSPAAFDIVILDTPPILEFADAQVVAARAGGCVLVTRRHRTRLADIERAKAELEPSGAELIGSVIND